MRSQLITLLLCTMVLGTVFGQKSEERSVQMWSSHDTSTNELVLQWKPSPKATVYSLSEWNGTSWSSIATLGDSVTEYRIANYQPEVKREFSILKFGGLQGYGYLEVGREIPLLDKRGDCLLVIDSSLIPQLINEVDTWIEDVEGDGWKVTVLRVGMDQSPVDIKIRINQWYGRSNGPQHSVFLLGHVPVPYSGLIFPDGHTDHNGAWPCDAYYGDMDGNWTDNVINNTSARDPRNRNIPGDGKFDQSTIASDVELQVGRADFYDLPAFSDDYIELTRQYLNKNHAFRTASFEVKRRGLIENNFANFDEGFGQNGWKNFSAMVGPDSIFKKDYETTLESEDYLWAYACGAGSYTSIGGIGNTTSLYVDREIKAVFVMNFGSYFGDWDKTNNILRAALASGTVLTNAWAARPNWQFHHMALGQPIGFSARVSQNNSFRYTPGFGARSVHVALLGDPTLRLHPVEQPVFTRSEQVGEIVHLEWNVSDSAIEDFAVYRKETSEEDFVLLGHTNGASLFSDSIVKPQTSYVYQIRSIKLERSPSGTYYNSSVGKNIEIQTGEGCLPLAAFQTTTLLDKVTTTNMSQQGLTYLWDFGDGQTSTDFEPEHIYDQAGTYEICLVTVNDCGDDRICHEVSVTSSLPSNITVTVEDVKCFGDSTGAIVFEHDGGKNGLEYSWSTGHQDSVLIGIPAGMYNLDVMTVTGRMATYGPYKVDQPDQIMADVMTMRLDSLYSSVTAAVYGGIPPYVLKWDNGTSTPDSLANGPHLLTVTDSNGCQSEFVFEISPAVATFDHDVILMRVFPNPASQHCEIVTEGHEELIGLHWSNALGQSGPLLFERIDKGRYLVDLDELPHGFYSLVGLTGNGTLLTNLIITR